MRSRTLAPRIAATLAITLALTASPEARADEGPSATDMAAARALGQEGVKLADTGNCQDAIERLSRAEKLFHAPTTLGRLGECQVQLGKIVDGTENLNKVVRESLAPGAPAAFVQAQERAKKVLAEAKPKIAKLKIAVAGPQDVAWTVKVDGEPMPLANLNTNRPMDPGEHVVEATAPGYKTARAKVTLPEGGNDSVALTLEADPNAPKAEPTPAPAPVVTVPQPSQQQETPLAKPTQPQEPPNRLPAYVALGVGVVGVGVGSVFGLMAASKKSDLEAACKDRVCGPDQQDNIDTGKTFGTVSTVGFVIGAVGLVAGAYLYLTSGNAVNANVARAASAPSRGVTPFVGIDHVGLVF